MSKERKATVQMPGIKVQDLLMLHATLLLYAVASVLGKLAGIQLAAQNVGKTLIFLAVDVATLLAYSFLWQRVLRRMPLSFAYSNKGICTLWTTLAGVFVIGEPFTWGKAAGLVVVLAGVTLVVTDHE